MRKKRWGHTDKETEKLIKLKLSTPNRWLKQNKFVFLNVYTFAKGIYIHKVNGIIDKNGMRNIRLPMCFQVEQGTEGKSCWAGSVPSFGTWQHFQSFAQVLRSKESS